MKAAIFGASGMLGRALVDELYAQGDVPVPILRERCDISNPSQIVDAILPSYDVVINAAGIIPSRHMDAAVHIQVNALAPHIMALVCEARSIPFIHVSTDCVFSGLGHPHPHHIAYIPDPDGIYGVSKRAGEVAAPYATTVRTSFIGPDHGLVRFVVDAPLRGDAELPGWTNALWSGSTVYEVARQLVIIARRRAARLDTAPLIHLATDAAISKYSVLTMIRDAFTVPVTITRRDDPSINRALVPTWEVAPLADCMQELVQRSAQAAPR